MTVAGADFILQWCKNERISRRYAAFSSNGNTAAANAAFQSGNEITCRFAASAPVQLLSAGSMPLFNGDSPADLSAHH